MDTENEPPLRIVVAGQMPPPYGGQNLNIERVFNILRGTERHGVEHWKFDFKPPRASAHRTIFAKVAELVPVLVRLVRLRAQGRTDYILYPTGGHCPGPNLRDVLLLPIACLVADWVCVHFQAAGQATVLANFPSPLRWLLKAAHRMCFGAIVLTEFGRQDAEALGHRRIAVIPNAVEDRASQFTERKSETDPVLLSVAQLCPDKGTPALLEACAQLQASGRRFRLRLVGECLYPYSEKELRETISRLGLSETVEWHGLLHGQELAEAYRTSDLFISNTVAPYESCGLVLIEAMMWGLPVVITDWRANAEVLGQSESAAGGICFPIGSDLATSLANAVDEAFGHQEQWVAWGLRNRERYENFFNVDVLKENLWGYFLHQGVAEDENT